MNNVNENKHILHLSVGSGGNTGAGWPEVKERVITPLVLLLRARPVLRLWPLVLWLALFTLRRWELVLLWTVLGDCEMRRELLLSVDAPLCLMEESPCRRQANLKTETRR